MYARNLESIVNNIDIRALTLAKYVQSLSPPPPPSYSPKYIRLDPVLRTFAARNDYYTRVSTRVQLLRLLPHATYLHANVGNRISTITNTAALDSPLFSNFLLYLTFDRSLESDKADNGGRGC